MISVCLTTYNGEKYILQQVQSIICQLNNSDELIISDDGSTDRTLEIIRNLNDKRIKIYLNINKGIISNVENALNKVIGDYIFLSDQDDVWLPDKVGKCLRALIDVDLVTTDCYVTDKNLNLISNSFFQLNNSPQNKWKALLRNPYLGCCMAFNRNILKDALPFPANIPMHDIWLGNVAAFRYKVKFIDDRLIYYRRHGFNLSTTSEPTKANIWLQIKYRIPVIQGLTNIFLKKKSKEIFK